MIVSYDLDELLPAAERGGDCHVRDRYRARNVYGPHHFKSTTHCLLSNGVIRAIPSVTGSAPALKLEVWRGPRIVGDTYTVTYHTTYGGYMDSGRWEPLGQVILDSPDVLAVMHRVEIVELTPELVRVRLVAPLIGDVFVTLRRGWRMLRITHGSQLRNLSIARRARLLDSPMPSGLSSTTGLLRETGGVLGSWIRFVASLNSTTAGVDDFSLTTPPRRQAIFGVGAGTTKLRDTPSDMHKQLRDVSKAQLSWVDPEDED